MSTEEERAAETYKAAGVDVPELNQAPEPTPEPEKKAEAPAPDAPAPTEGEKPKEEPKFEPLQEPKAEQPPKKRSIYDDLKDKKQDLRTEREAREAAERERDELKAKLEALGKAETPAEKKEASTDLAAFAAKTGMDANLLAELKAILLKDIPASQIDTELKGQLEEFQQWKATNQLTLEKDLFEKEFTTVTPIINEMFPKITDAEREAVKAEVDRISHTKEWHDKDLDYILFKHKDELNKLVSPKKRGMEGNDRQPEGNEDEGDFNFEADLTKMTPKQREVWEAEYRKRTASEGIVTDPSGRRTII